MKNLIFITLILLLGFDSLNGQSRRGAVYSESSPPTDKKNPQNKSQPIETAEVAEGKKDADESDVLHVDTDLVVIPAQIYSRDGKSVAGLKKEEFKIFENGVEQQLAYFTNEEQPFTVALVLDMSYSSLFKLEDIQAAAFAFVNQLRENDKVMIISFDEKVRVLCEATNNRKVLRLAIEGAKIASGTSFYTALNLVDQKLKNIGGRKAVVLLSDGVDTSSPDLTADDILKNIGSTDVLIYPIQYDTYDDVQKTRKETAQVFYDDKDRAIVVETPKKNGEREEDYKRASNFLREMANLTGGRADKVSSTTNLNQAFARIADELRKIYSLGFYPGDKRKTGVRYALKVRVYRPNLLVRTRNSYTGK
jgi:VWFA-related protein